VPRAGRDSPDDATIRSDAHAHEETHGSVLVIADTAVSAFPLPQRGVMVIGRADDADVQLAHRSVSRHHARLHVGEIIAIEDLGSVNGTRIGGRDIAANAPARIAPGDVVEVGDVTLLVRPRQPAEPAVRRMSTEAQLREQIGRRCTARRALPFAVVRVATDPHAGGIGELILSQLRSGEMVTALGASEWAVLLADTAPTEAAAICERLRRSLSGRARLVRIAVACHPDDGATADELLTAAGAGLAAGAEPAGVVVADPRMRALLELVDRIATSPISVLLLGETGVGKEVFAERIHRRSDRAGKPMLRLNCAAFTESLLEAELFGHEKGAFTGATDAKPGLLETADGGTVFLDEIGDLPASLQAKLLRVLEDSQVRRVGGLSARTIDVRIIAATHRDLESESAGGGFRKDLYFRLNGVAIDIPPLRDRPDEIAPLARAFVERAATRARRAQAPVVSPAAMAALAAYAWPGNVRELRNTMERAVLLCADCEIQPRHLPDRIGAAPAPGAPADDDGGEAEFDEPSVTLRVRRDELERDVIEDALRRANGNQTRAARLLGVARSTLVKRLEKYNLPRPRKPDGDDDQ
jgi:two-component system, NtrC family, response regulator AtoC